MKKLEFIETLLTPVDPKTNSPQKLNYFCQFGCNISPELLALVCDRVSHIKPLRLDIQPNHSLSDSTKNQVAMADPLLRHQVDEVGRLLRRQVFD